jgi:hypothetical protein
MRSYCRTTSELVSQLNDITNFLLRCLTFYRRDRYTIPSSKKHDPEGRSFIGEKSWYLFVSTQDPGSNFLLYISKATWLALPRKFTVELRQLEGDNDKIRYILDLELHISRPSKL